MDCSSRQEENYRGIDNISGVSCHISCALQLIYHTMPNLRNCLIEYYNGLSLLQRQLLEPIVSKEYQFLKDIASLFQEIHSTNNCTNNNISIGCINPTPFYTTLQNCTKLNYSQVGDAATALRTILSTIQSSCRGIASFILKNIDTMDNDGKLLLLLKSVYRLNQILEKSLNGTIQQQIKSIQTRKEKTTNIVTTTIKKRPYKKRPLTHPLPLPVKHCYTITEALQCALGHTKPIQNYTWKDKQDDIIETITKIRDQTNDCSSSSSSSSDDDDSSIYSSASSSSNDSSDSSSSSSSAQDWKTYNYQTFHQLPNHLILHLKRLEFTKESKKKLLTQKCNVPSMLNLSFLSSTTSTNEDKKYQLMGAIVHIQPPPSMDSNEEEDGHYVAYIKKTKKDIYDTSLPLESLNLTPTNSNEWVHFDDENVSFIDASNEKDLLHIFSGGNHQKAIFHRNTDTTPTNDRPRKDGVACATVLMYVRLHQQPANYHLDIKNDAVTLQEINEYYKNSK